MTDTPHGSPPRSRYQLVKSVAFSLGMFVSAYPSTWSVPTRVVLVLFGISFAFDAIEEWRKGGGK